MYEGNIEENDENMDLESLASYLLSIIEDCESTKRFSESES